MFSITKMKAMYEVFSQGKAVANPQLWRTHQISTTMLAGLFVAILQLAKSFGYDLGIDTDTCTTLAVGVISLVNVGITVASSKEHGLPASEQALPSLQQGSPEGEAQSPMQPVSVAAAEPTAVGTTSIDAATVERAKQWAAEHREPAVRHFDNDQNEGYCAG